MLVRCAVHSREQLLPAQPLQPDIVPCVVQPATYFGACVGVGTSFRSGRAW